MLFLCVHNSARSQMAEGLLRQLGGDGFEVCRRIRAAMRVPIIMLTARDDPVDRIVGLEVGADDYVTKPFSVRELVARVKAHLRREAMLRQQRTPEQPPSGQAA